MIVNYRDRKSVIRLFRILMPVAFIVLCICPSWSNMSGNSIASSAPDEIIDTENEAVQQLVDPINTFDYEGNDYLKRDAIIEINELITNYYKAELELDMDTMEGLVSDIEQVNYSKLQTQLEYMESIDNIICYTIAGDIEGTYRVYVYYDMKLRGIDTPAPALSALYVTMSSDGRYIVYLSELDSETQDFILKSDESEEVLILKALVEERFCSVVESDTALSTFVNMLQSNSSETTDAEASEPDVTDTQAVSDSALQN